jgi:hypothetical protein
MIHDMIRRNSTRIIKDKFTCEQSFAIGASSSEIRVERK